MPLAPVATQDESIRAHLMNSTGSYRAKRSAGSLMDDLIWGHTHTYTHKHTHECVKPSVWVGPHSSWPWQPDATEAETGMQHSVWAAQQSMYAYL